MKKKKSLKDVIDFAQPQMAEGLESRASTSTRRNVAGSIERTDRFKNIDDGLVPFKYSGNHGGNSSVDVRDAVILCQKCYYNFAIFRNIIDLMTEFSVNNIFYRGGTKKSRDFFAALFDKINLWDLQDKFFREFFRSGNVFLYRFDTNIEPSDVSKITKIYGGVDDLEVEELKIPNRYLVLNPADIQLTGSANFAFGAYYKMLTAYELAQLKKPKTQEDVETFQSLPEKIQKAIKDRSSAVMIPLDVDRISAIFYKKQDYEPFAVPMGYPVLEDINAKAEMKKIDMAIARTMQQMILLVTTGYEGKDGSYNVNQKTIDTFNALFTNKSVGRVLVADFTTKAEWKVPDVADILNAEKYKILDDDINIGLNNVFIGGEKFANQAQKVEIFIARLQQARQAFLNNFLIPEIKRISKSVGFQSFPTPYFEDFELKDTTNAIKNYIQMMGMGALTPEQTIKAIETGTLPDPELMEESQKAYKEQRDSGLYEPLIGGAKGEEGEGAGRPTGAKAPKKITPIGGGPKKKTKASELKFSIAKIKENLVLAEQLENKVLGEIKNRAETKKPSKLHKELAHKITSLIVANEEVKDWESNIKKYCDTPIDQNQERVNKIIAIAAEHQLEDDFLASILLASKADEPLI